MTTMPTRLIAWSFVALAVLACSGGAGASDDLVAPGDVRDPVADAASDSEVSGDASLPPSDVPGPDGTASADTHPLGMVAPPFRLRDLNPASPTYDQDVSSADLNGKPYALVFLDSRCIQCADVADGLWLAYQQHPGWWGAQPTFAIERAKALAQAPDTVAGVVDGNGLPYLADSEETNLWMAFLALNHDFFAISADGTLDAWLPLYDWPEDLAVFVEHMTGRYGP
jgi:hypothetical protein